MPERWRLPAAAAAVFVLAAAVHAWLEFRLPQMLMADGYTHMKMAWLYWTGELPLFGGDFPWTRYSSFNDLRHDWQLLYHLALIPFAGAGLVTGGKLSAVFLAAALVTTAYVLLRRHRASPAWLWCLLFALSAGPLVWRMHLPRPTTLTVICLLVLAHLAATRRLRAVGVASALTMLVYNVPHALLALGAVSVGVLTLVDRRIHWRLAAAFGAGVLAGVVLHPGFWHWQGSFLGLDHASFALWRQIQGTVAAAVGEQMVAVAGGRVGMRVPVELLPMDGASAIATGFALPLGLLLAAGAWLAVRRERVEPMAAICLLMAAVFFWLFLDARRFMEQWVPFAVLGAAIALRTLPARLPPPVLASALVAVLSLALVNAHDAWARLSRDGDHYGDRYRPALDWIAENSERGELVFHTDWDDFGPMFFYNHHNHYLVGFDPYFLYQHDPELFLRWKLTTYGKLEPEQTRASIRSYGARYVFSRREQNWEALLAQLSRAPWAERVFADDFAVVYAIR